MFNFILGGCFFFFFWINFIKNLNDKVRDGNPFARETIERLQQEQLAQRKKDALVQQQLEAQRVQLAVPKVGTSALAVSDDSVLITSTTINVAKFIGKYAQMMHTLDPIAYQIFLGIAQLFDFYVSDFSFSFVVLR